MELIINFFKMDENDFIEYENNTTDLIKSYFNNTMDIRLKKCYDYLEFLDSNHNKYLQFGADKCEVDDFIEFCKELNIDYEENIKLIKKNKKENNDIYKYHFFSRDKKITFSCSNYDNYMHYFGITGESSEIIKIFEIFNRRCKYTEICFGGRDYI